MLAFSIFAWIIPAATNLEFVCPPELFPTRLRASGVGLAVASSRFGSAISTFLLPLAVQHLGIHATLGVRAGVLALGGVFCHFMAQETGDENLWEVGSQPGADDEPGAQGGHQAVLGPPAKELQRQSQITPVTPPARC